VRFFQYRNKRGSRRAVFETAQRLASLFRGTGALFIVNDHADIAMAVNADGIHLGQDDLPLGPARKLLGHSKIIGISTHSVEEAVTAERGGADYIGFGPLFPTATKDAGPLQGTGRLDLVRAAVSIPIVAIGGIGPENAGEAIRHGANGVAVITAVLDAPDIKAACRSLREEIGRSAVIHSQG
jgi:thiamine-phosphate pyrophosphorylase